MRQGNDVGTQYRSAIYTTSDEQRDAGRGVARRVPGRARRAAGYGEITTEIAAAGPFYYAEDYHQQYLGEEPERLLRPRRHRRLLPDRRRRRRLRRLAPATRGTAAARPALIVFIANCDVIRARPGRSANVLIRNCS